MKRFALIGNPLTHSFSKSYFQAKFEREGIEDATYENIEITSEEELKNILAQKVFHGFNVTIPWKEDVLKFVSEISPECKAIQSANVLMLTDNGYKAFNTDYIGFRETLKPLLKPFHTSALILGNGGSSKAIAYVLNQLDIDFQIASRETSQGQIINYGDIRAIDIRNASVIINTTPLGMSPNVNTFPAIPYEGMDKFHLAYDLVYNPAETLFLKKAGLQGAMTKNGYDMLIRQAEESWKIWMF
ncbi:MAG: shikimate dehydrogenase [Bacteroidota bacterium]|jgi:shikimate dehydrogenase